MSTGTDMMLNSVLRLAGVDPAMIKAFAADMIEKGTLQKIIAFGDGIDETNKLLRNIRDDYHLVCSNCGGNLDAVSQAGGIAERSGSDADTDAGFEPDRDSAELHGGGVSGELGSDRRLSNDGIAYLTTDDVNASAVPADRIG